MVAPTDSTAIALKAFIQERRLRQTTFIPLLGHHLRHTRWSIAEILNAVHCYEYQACEPPEWETSEAAAFCRSLTHTLIAALPGYRTGAWAIMRTSEPAPAGDRLNNAKIGALEDVLNELSALRRRRAAVLETGCDVVDFDEEEVDLLGDVATAAAATVATL